MLKRAGQYVLQPTGYKAFIPEPLPPNPPLHWSATSQTLLSEADQALARLDGTVETLPNADLFVAMYVRQEAVLSSQIEGTQSSLIDILKFEAQAPREELPLDLTEVYNYVKAMNFGLKRLSTLPLSLRLINEIHRVLVSGVRGGEKTPGEFRRSQNWIGPPGSTLSEAVFVPPPEHEMRIAMGQLEKFMHDETPMPVLVRCGLVHAQFETIHPFLDGNGRIGRLLITLMLCAAGVLHRPLLYLSLFLREHRTEYYDRLMRVRDEGDWEAWIEFFLRGVRSVSKQAADRAREILRLHDRHRTLIEEKIQGSLVGVRLLEFLFRHPVISAKQVGRALRVSAPTTYHLIGQFQELGLLEEMTGRRRNRLFKYQPYLSLFEAARQEKRGEGKPHRTGLFEEPRRPSGR
jgi:Fic family protein